MKGGVKLVITQAEMDMMIEERLAKLKRKQAIETLQLEQAIAKLGAELAKERERRVGSRLRRWIRKVMCRPVHQT